MTPVRQRIIISVINDLVTDQRVDRQATTLNENGYDVLVIGRRLKNSLPLGNRSYKTLRLRLPFEKGFLFYFFFNKILFWFLLFNKADILLANDLDTLLPNYLVSKIKGIKLVYDSHEYFTEVPELVNHPFNKKIWTRIEKFIFPRLTHVMTVNNSIAGIYFSKYNVPVSVVRNLPVKKMEPVKPVLRSEWGLPQNEKIFLFQGSGINVDRGAEEAIEAIKMVSGAVLLFIGGGDVIQTLRKKVMDNKLSSKVFFIPKQPMKELIRLTSMADAGLTLDKNTNLNYKYSLPNKLFDYIQANIPVLASNLIEVRSIISKYDIGMITSEVTPVSIAETMNKMISDPVRFDGWKKNLNIAAEELCWEKEQQNFLTLFIDGES